MAGEGKGVPRGLCNGPFRLGDFLVDPQRNRITGSGECAVQPKAIDLLCVLAERHGEVLPRAELIDRVWGREFGADESLTRAISQLRKAFGDTREQPQVIETISKRGYRLIVPPEPVAEDARAPGRSRRRIPLRWIAIGAAALIILFIAVMPLLRTDPGELAPPRSERTGIVVTVEPFVADPGLAGGGFTDELAAAIARSPLVRVRTGTPPAEPDTLQYRLRGTIRRMGDRVRVDAQLADAATGEVVWGESFDRRFDTQFSERASIVGTISSETLLPLLRSAKGKADRRAILSLAPWELTLLVTWVPGSEGRPPGPPSEESYWLQRRALELDPDYAPAHALFAQLASYHALFHPPFDNARARTRARDHADRALELAPYDAEVLYQVALHHRFAGNRERAAATLDRVLELQPSHPLARIDRPFVAGQCRADSDAAVEQLQRTAELLPPSSPTRWVTLAHLSALHLGRGEFAQAREAALRSRRIVRMTWTTLTLAAADAELGNRAEALAALADERRAWPDLDVDDFADRVVPRWCLGGPRTPQVQASFRKLAAMAGRHD